MPHATPSSYPDSMTTARQTLILMLLDALGGEAGNLDFQKFQMLYIREVESTPGYEFVPYRFGASPFTPTTTTES